MGQKFPSSVVCIIGVSLTFAASCISGGQQVGQLQRAQGYYERNDYDRALAIFRNLDQEREQLDQASQTRYFYLRGMTDYRLGYQADARHWLSLAKASRAQNKKALEEEERKRLTSALDDLNQVFFARMSSVDSNVNMAHTACQWSSECTSGLLCSEGFCKDVNKAVQSSRSSTEEK